MNSQRSMDVCHVVSEEGPSRQNMYVMRQGDKVEQ